jgi:hypothetical protein
MQLLLNNDQVRFYHSEFGTCFRTPNYEVILLVWDGKLDGIHDHTPPCGIHWVNKISNTLSTFQMKGQSFLLVQTAQFFLPRMDDFINLHHNLKKEHIEHKEQGSVQKGMSTNHYCEISLTAVSLQKTKTWTILHWLVDKAGKKLQKEIYWQINQKIQCSVCSLLSKS